MRLQLLGYIFILFPVCISGRSRRLRRQVLPSQHVQVHSLDSNVVYNNDIYVESTENRIDLKERTFNGSIWADHSLLNFDSHDTFVNVSADNVESYLTIINGANLYGQGIKANFYIHTNRTQNGYSAISHSMFGSANFSIEDEALRVQVIACRAGIRAVNGNKIASETETWQRSIESKMTLNAESTGTHERELRLEALGKTYHTLVVYSGSTLFVNFANKIIRLGNDYRNVEIFTDKYNVTVITRDAPYDITLTQEEVIINLPTQRTRVCVTLNGVNVKSNQVAKTHVERNNGVLTIGGEKVEGAGTTIIAGTTSLDLNNAGEINADLTGSHFIVDNNIQQVGLISSHQTMKIDQGFPKITIDPGESCVEIVANRGLPKFADIIPPFKIPQDIFKNIGPFDEDLQAELDFYNKPSCCSVTSSPGSRTSSGEWSEWGNNGNNGGWNTGVGGTIRSGEIVRTTIRSRPIGSTTTHAPEFGHWPTFSPTEETVTRRNWPDSFPSDSNSTDWEKEQGCNCKSTVPVRMTTLTSRIIPTVSISSLIGTQPNIEEETTTERISTVSSSVITVETTFPSTLPLEDTSPLTDEEERTFPQPAEMNNTIERISTTTTPFPTLVENTTEREASPTEQREDFMFYQYPSTLFPPPPQINIEATVSSIGLNNNNELPEGFPAPSFIGSGVENVTEKEWSGGASSLEMTSTPGEDFPSPLSNNASFVRRSPLLLTLRIPQDAVGRRTDLATNIRESLRRVIRGASKRKLAKRDLSSNSNDVVKITSIKEQNGTLEVVFDLEEGSYIEEGDLLSLSSQEMSQYFDYPVISLVKIEEIGDNRLVYIFLAFGLALMTVFCLCCIFQAVIKQMSQALLVNVGRRFHKQADINQQYQNHGAPC